MWDHYLCILKGRRVFPAVIRRIYAPLLDVCCVTKRLNSNRSYLFRVVCYRDQALKIGHRFGIIDVRLRSRVVFWCWAFKIIVEKKTVYEYECFAFLISGKNVESENVYSIVIIGLIITLWQNNKNEFHADLVNCKFDRFHSMFRHKFFHSLGKNFENGEKSPLSSTRQMKFVNVWWIKIPNVSVIAMYKKKKKRERCENTQSSRPIGSSFHSSVKSQTVSLMKTSSKRVQNCSSANKITVDYRTRLVICL